MKKFLVIGMILLMGLMFLSSKSYAKDPRKRNGYVAFGLSQIFTEAHKDIENSENPWHRGSYTFSMVGSFDHFRTFVEGTVYISGSLFEQSMTLNWILTRSNEGRSNFMWLYAGGGFSFIAVANKKDGYKYYGTHIGLKAFMGQLYLDVRLNFFFNESLPLVSGYPSVTLGFWL